MFRYLLQNSLREKNGTKPHHHCIMFQRDSLFCEFWLLFNENYLNLTKKSITNFWWTANLWSRHIPASVFQLHATSPVSAYSKSTFPRNLFLEIHFSSKTFFEIHFSSKTFLIHFSSKTFERLVRSRLKLSGSMVESC